MLLKNNLIKSHRISDYELYDKYSSNTNELLFKQKSLSRPKILFAIISVLLLFIVSPLIAKPNPFTAGTGSEEDPYQISTPTEMDMVRNFPDAYFVLNNNLDLSVAFTDWTPIGTEDNPFSGNFYGNDYTIKYVITSAANAEVAGLFGYSAGKFSNLGVNADIYSFEIAGGLVANNRGLITNCHSAGSVTSNENDGFRTGGLVGHNDTGGEIEYCYSTCNVSGQIQVGGLVGANRSIIRYSYSTGMVYGQSGVGGLSGTNWNEIRYSYSTSAVQGENEVGGFVGYIDAPSSVYGSYSAGIVRGNTKVGGFVGTKEGNTYNSFYDITSSGQASGKGAGYGLGNLFGKTTAQMKVKTNFSSEYQWDFVEAWKISEGNTYPGLQAIDNAPFAFCDEFAHSDSILLEALLNNDYDIETGQANLVYSIISELKGTAKIRKGYYLFPDNSVSGYIDTLYYMIGEELTPGDTLWGNIATAIFTKKIKGSGTPADPFLIYSAKDMNSVRDYPDAEFKLMVDIDLTSAYPDWEPIGDVSSAFTGVFNGNYHLVKYQITSSDRDYAGLFGLNAGTIKRLRVNANVTANDFVGGLTGYSTGAILTCSSTGTIKSYSEYQGNIGGLVGMDDGGTIDSSYNTANVTATSTGIGGLVGRTYGSNITACFSSGNITGIQAVGGLAGIIGTTNVISCYSSCTVSGNYYTGGLIGYNDGNISNCYSTGDITGDDMIGGLVGSNYNTITNSYSLGRVTAKYGAGGFVGSNLSTGSIVSCYYHTSLSNQSNGIGTNSGSGSVLGIVFPETRQQSTYSGFDFTSTWQIKEGVSYPALKGINNVPFAIQDTLKSLGYINLSRMLLNDYDYETSKSNLIYKILEVDGDGTLNNEVYTFGVGTNGYITYRIGEVNAATNDTIWGNSANASLENAQPGEGTEEKPYLIFNTQEMNLVNEHTNAYYSLMDDIDLTVDYPNWLPIGISEEPYNFSGYFNGNGHTVKYKITSADNSIAGLFGKNVGTIENLGTDANINVATDGVGGIAALNAGIIRSCHSTGTVISESSYVGGLVGYNEGPIDSCYSTCNVRGASDVGGLVGITFSTISFCYSTGSVTSEYASGGLVGTISNTTVSSCYSTGEVSSGETAGGFTAYNSGTIVNSYSTGKVTGLNNAGGFIGRGGEVWSVTSCYYNLTTSGVNKGFGDDAGSVPGLTLANMKKQASFSGWDFTNTWQIIQDQTYPTLKMNNDAPFAFADAFEAPFTVELSNLLTNDYDFESGQTKLVYKVVNVYGEGTTDAQNYTFPSWTLSGYKDSLLYRVGELRTNDTLWGNTAIAVITEITGLTVSTNAIHFNAAENNAVVSLNCNTNWSATPSDPWLSLDNTSGTGPLKITISATQNTTGSVRTGTVTFSASGVSDVVVMVVQDAQIPLSISFYTYNKEYNGTATAVAYPYCEITSGLLPDDYTTSAVIVDANYADKNVGINKTVTATITLEGPDAGIYSYNATLTSTANITAKALTVTGATASKIYDGTAVATIAGATLSGAIVNDDVTLTNATLGTYDNANVGTGKAVANTMGISGTDAGNYAFTAPTLTGNITAKELTITDALITTKVYDGATTATITGAVLSGVVYTEDVTLTNATGGSFDNANAGTGKTVTTTMGITGAAIGNYTFTQPTLTGNITAKELTVTGASVATKAYDGTTDASISGATLTGVIGTEDVTLANAATGVFNNANAGTGKSITTTMTITGTAISNYTLSQPTLTGEITAKTITVTADANQGKVYGAINPDYTYAVNPVLLNSDAFTGKLERVTGENVGVYAINQGTLSASTNYAITFVGSNFTITAKELSVTGATVASKIYDGTNTATITGATLSGIVGTDNVTLTNATSGTYSNANVGTGKTITTAMSITGTDAGNYTLAQPSLVGDITQATLTISITAQNKVYDGNTDAAASVSIKSGLVTGDVVTANVSNAVFDNKNAGDNKTVTATIAISGADAANYSCNTTATATANITKASLTIGITAQNKAYDGNTDAAASASITSGLITGDVVTANANNGVFDNKNAGDNKTVTANIAISGTDAGNYSCNTTASAMANITKASLVAEIAALPNIGYCKGNIPVTYTVTYPTAIDASEGAPNISFKGAGIDTSAEMSSKDRMSWTYQWIAPVTGNGNITIDAALQDVAGNFNQSTSGKTSVILDNTLPVLTISGLTDNNPANTIVNINFSETVGLISGNLQGTIILREGSSNGSNVPFTLANSTDSLAQLTFTATLKCNTSYYLAVKAGLFADVAGNKLPLLEKTFTTSNSGCQVEISSTEKGADKVSVYPTVNRGMFNVKMEHPENGQVTVKVFNMSGIALNEYHYIKSSQIEIFPVNMNATVAGQYLVEVSMNDFREMKWIMVDNK